MNGLCRSSSANDNTVGVCIMQHGRKRRVSQRMRLLSDIVVDPYNDDYLPTIGGDDPNESRSVDVHTPTDSRPLRTAKRIRKLSHCTVVPELVGNNIGSLRDFSSLEPNQLDNDVIVPNVEINVVPEQIDQPSVCTTPVRRKRIRSQNCLGKVMPEHIVQPSLCTTPMQRKRIRSQNCLGKGQSCSDSLNLATDPAQSSDFARMSRRFTLLPIVDAGKTSVFRGYDIPTTSDIFVRERNCNHCHAVRFKFEPKNFCCMSGRIKLHLSEPPNELYELFCGSSQQSNNFRKYIRIYNANFAFTSMGVHLDESLMRANAGIYTFRIQGQMHHSLKPLNPGEAVPSALQLYFHDTDNELHNRLQFSSYLLPDVLQLISTVMTENPYARFFRSLSNLDSVDQYSISLAVDPAVDQRVYNTPTVSQVAAMWVEDGTMGDHFDRNILVHGWDDKSYPIFYNYGCYDALQYPLLFPRGEVGWHPNISRSNSRRAPVIRDNETIAHFLQSQQTNQQSINGRTRITCRDYYCYKLQIRPEQRNILLTSGRLFQQYVVDMYVKIETGRLQYLRNNQPQIRADLYQGLLDSVQMGLLRGVDVGKRVILPTTFIGGPRDMRKRYLDAMALVRKFGKPDLFITMTCNPNWPEIKNELEPYELAQDRPDLTSRIFRAKLEHLKKKLIEESFFGEVAAYVYVVEFQKRGLPHAHFLIILKSGFKIVTPEQVDKFVCAEIPSPTEHPILHAIVVKHMMHGPCGILNPTNICMNANGGCKNDYPKDLSEFTTLGNDSFPSYKRSRHSPIVTVRCKQLNNRWVVPYNPLLLAELNCHINVEVCSSIKAVKYLYKYIYKGHDRIRFHVGNETPEVQTDEIREYQDARWISPPEAAWRIYSFSLNEMYPHVYPLQVHLPSCHPVTYSDSTDLQRLITMERASKSMLTEYFHLNRTSPFACSLLYKQIPEHFVWDKSAKIWTQRKQRLVIGRMMAVGPAEGERYYLRLLLSHIKGACSFEELRTVNSIVCETFRDACLLRDLLQNDDHYTLCFEEAVVYAMPIQLRQLFVVILAFCSPQDPRKIWLGFKTDMSSDYSSRGYSTTNAERMALNDLHYMLEQMGKNINEYHLVDHQIDVGLCERVARIIDDERQIQITEADLAGSSSLNPTQQNIFDMVMHSITTISPLLLFVDGPGGTGKTFLYRTLLAHVRKRGLIALATASSGVAAGILPGGRTAHYRFKIPLDATESMQCNVSKQSALAALLRTATLIIWDEAPMMHRFCVEAVDRLMQDLTGSSLPFGGKIVLLSGDFRQVLPVIPRASRSEICKAVLVNSYLWPLFEKKTLTHNMRAHNDPSFSAYLLQIGNGIECMVDKDIVSIPDEMLIPFEDDDISVKKLLKDVFPDLGQWEDNCYQYINRVVLTPKNESVDAINNSLVDQFPGEMRTYYSYDEPIDSTEGTFDEDYLNTLSLSGVPPHELKLKLNCPIILLRNLNSAEGLSNGTRLICRQFHSNLIEAEISDGHRRGKNVLLPRIPFIPRESQQNPFSFKRTQFPIRLCFAMTINKAQGQTLDYVGLYLREPVFSHGQLYVALSRVKSRNSIKVLISPCLPNLPPNHTKNVVYTDILDVIRST